MAVDLIKTKPNILNRIVSGIIDYSIILIATSVIAYTLGEPTDEGTYRLSGYMALIPVAFWLFMTVGLEVLLGATLGNSIVGLRAIPISGKNVKLTFIESLKRHLLDPIDMFFFGVVGILTIMRTEKNQRLGDLWANTIVVEAKSL